MSTLKSAIELKQVFDKLQQAEQSGMAPEDLRKLEEHAAEQGLRTMWKVCLPLYPYDYALIRQGVKLEVESVTRETAEKVLTEPGVPREKLAMRMVALDLLADVSDSVLFYPSFHIDRKAFLSVKRDGEIEEFVKVDTPSSKQREAEASAREKSRLSQQAPSVPSRPAGASQPPPTPPRPAQRQYGVPPTSPPAQDRESVLKAAYKACKSNLWA